MAKKFKVLVGSGPFIAVGLGDGFSFYKKQIWHTFLCICRNADMNVKQKVLTLFQITWPNFDNANAENRAAFSELVWGNI